MFLANDDRLCNFLLLGSFRSNEEGSLGGLRSNIDADVVTDVKLDNLPLEILNDLIANLLRREANETQEFSQVVHWRSSGNPYFALQLLFQFQSQNILVYDFVGLKWEWDMSRVLLDSNVSNTVIDVITERICESPTKVQRLLQLASCLGFIVDQEVLQDLDKQVTVLLREDRELGESKSDDEHFSFSDALKVAQEENFFEPWSTGVVKFSHDRVQQVAYEAIGENVESIHHDIGLRLHQMYQQKNTTKSEDNELLYMAVRQLGKAGNGFFVNDAEKLQFIELNCQAASAARGQGRIATASEFLAKAVDITRDTFWVTHYDLILNAHNNAAETHFALGMVEKANAILWTIKKHAKNNTDKIQALVIEYQMLGISCQFVDAISHGGQILRLLGEKVPKKLGLHHVAVEYLRARWEARKKPDDFFTSLEPTESRAVKTKLHILRIGAIYGWNGDTNFAAFAMLRGFRLSIRHGWSESTPFLYAGYGFMLGLFGDIEEAYRFGQLALQASKFMETMPNATILAFASLIHLKKPLNTVLEPNLEAYRIGLETGDLFHGTICLACYAVGYIACGLRLAPYSADMLNYCYQLKICNQDLSLLFIVVPRQLALNLTGNSSNSVLLSQEAIRVDQTDFYAENLFSTPGISEGIIPAGILYMWYLQLFNAYILEDKTVAATTMKSILKLKPISRRLGGTHMMNYFLAFMDGLVGLWLSHEGSANDRRLFKRIAKSATKELKGMSSSGRATNSMTLLRFLTAAKSSQKASISADKARNLFNPAITELSRSGLLHFTAIANEFAGKCMLEKEESFWAKHYLSEAYQRWSDYDATVKAEQMLKKYSILKRADIRMHQRTSDIQGRSRYDSTTDSVFAKHRDGRSSEPFVSRPRDPSEQASSNWLPPSETFKGAVALTE